MAKHATAERKYTTAVDYPAMFWSQATPKDLAFAAALRGFDSVNL
ncbi:MAG: hypothetical protein AAF950_01215 [Pseudomonadota bacterium]